jgi:hypothetical protein
MLTMYRYHQLRCLIEPVNYPLTTVKPSLTKMIEISISRIGKLESAEADIVEGLIINAECLVGVLDELMHRKGGIVRLDDGI